MNRISSVMKMHLRDKLNWYIVPLAVLGSSFFINLLIGFLTDTPIYTGGIMSIYIYLFVMGIIVLPQTFNFALSFSIRRNDYFTGTSFYAIVSSFAVSVILLLMAFIEESTKGWGTDLHFFSIPYLNEGSYMQELFITFMLTVTMFFGGFTIGSIYRRFRGLGMLIMATAVFAFLIVMSFLISHYGWGDNIIAWISDHTAFQISLWLIPAGFIFALFSYLLLRKSTV